MQYRTAWAAALALSACGGVRERLGVRPTSAASTVYVRADTDDTTVVSPGVSAAAAATEAVTVDASYAVDAWTGASVDVVTAATSAITEQRHEVNAGVGYERDELRLSTRYRHSSEPDYQSHGLVLGGARDLADRNTTVAVDLAGSLDEVGRSGDPGFAAPQWSAGARARLAQVLGRRTIAELGWETTRIAGFQASPYRWVAIGGDGVCAGAAPFCVPEQVPDVRYRHALSGRLRRALGDTLSAGAEYRFYVDSWGVLSHAIQPDLTWLVTDADTLTVRVRYYTQGEATFYRPRYFDRDATDGFVTRDRKLSAFFTGEAGASYVHRWELDDGERVLSLGLRGSGSWLEYLAYVGLERVFALELTTSLGLAWE